jgi:hypothetical protein
VHLCRTATRDTLGGRDLADKVVMFYGRQVTRPASPTGRFDVRRTPSVRSAAVAPPASLPPRDPAMFAEVLMLTRWSSTARLEWLPSIAKAAPDARALPVGLTPV